MVCWISLASNFAKGSNSALSATIRLSWFKVRTPSPRVSVLGSGNHCGALAAEAAAPSKTGKSDTKQGIFLMTKMKLEPIPRREKPKTALAGCSNHGHPAGAAPDPAIKAQSPASDQNSSLCPVPGISFPMRWLQTPRRACRLRLKARSQKFHNSFKISLFAWLRCRLATFSTLPVLPSRNPRKKPTSTIPSMR